MLCLKENVNLVTNYFRRYSLRITRMVSATVSNILSFRSFSNTFSISSGTDTRIRFIGIYLLITIDIFNNIANYYIIRYLMKALDKCNREESGKEIALNPNVQILRINDYTYHVKSQTTNREYDVISTEKGWICGCPDHTFRHICCKHIHAVEFSIRLREQVRKENAVTIEQLNVSVCTYCNSDKIVKHGVRHNDNYDIQRWFCNDCKKWFSFNIGFEKMRANPQAVTSAMQLYFTGESLRSIQKFLRLQGVTVSHQVSTSG